jgi:LuxR family maltose regulon positive regulatory protein
MAARSAAASAAYWAGEVELARERAVEALALLEDPGLSLERVFLYQYLAIVAADAGDNEAALAHADQALTLVDPGKETSHLPTLAHLARSIALLGLGRPVDAGAALDDARRVAGHRREPLNDAAIELHQARLLHQAGDQEAARAAVRAARGIVADLPDPRFDDRIRSTENAIRFVATDADALPVGARELTERERAVLALLPHDLSRRELARQLHVSENTVKSHLTSIRHKLGVAGRDSIVERAVDLGLIPGAGPIDD